MWIKVHVAPGLQSANIFIQYEHMLKITVLFYSQLGWVDWGGGRRGETVGTRDLFVCSRHF